MLVPRVIFEGAIHLGDPDGDGIEVVVVAPQAVVHPHAVVLGSSSLGWPFDGVHLGSELAVGDRAIRWGGALVQVARWWSPTPALGPTDEDRLVIAARTVQAAMTTCTPPLARSEADRLRHLVAMLRAGDAPASADAALRLLGLGDGSTPTGDDLLAGLIAGIDRFASALRPPPAPQVLAAHRQLVDIVLGHVDTATTALSAVLLRHAAEGQVCRPAGRLIVAMARGLDERALRGALNDLLAVGSSSGRDLTLGLLAAVEVLTDPDASGGPGGSTHLDVPIHLDGRGAAVRATSSSIPERP